MTKQDEMLAAAIIDQINAELGAANMSISQLAKIIDRPYDSTRNYLKKERQIPFTLFFEIVAAVGVAPEDVIKRARERIG